jgi:hypothetical protein
MKSVKFQAMPDYYALLTDGIAIYN